jgi:glycosyltransferase involved in cell wall biosynthesis
MASSKPVVARDIIGPQNIITQNHDGFLFHSLKELKEHMRLLSIDADLRASMGANARRTVEQRFTIKSAAQRYERLFIALHS